MRKTLSFLFSLPFLCILTIAVQLTAIVFLCFYLRSLLPVGVGAMAGYLLNVLAVMRLYATRRPSEAVAARLCLCLWLPFVGAILCLSTTKPRYVPVAVADKPFSGDYFSDGQAFFARLFDDLSRAERTIDLTFFILSSSSLTTELFVLLQRATRRGVKVRICYDAVGSLFALPRRQLKQLKRSGVQVKAFHRWIPLPLAKLTCRDHRKLVVIDGKTAWTGGVNVGDEYVNRVHPHGYWKDTGVRLTGEGVEHLQHIQDDLWERRPTPMTGTVVCHCPPYSAGLWEDTLLSVVYRSHKRVWIMTPYLIPTRPIFDALADAVRRGVDVKLLIPAVPDKPHVYLLTREYARRLIERGVTVLALTDSFVHAKSILCDDTLLCGSANCDVRSLLFNYECDAVLTDARIVSQAERDFLHSFSLSQAPDEDFTRWQRCELAFLRPLIYLF